MKQKYFSIFALYIALAWPPVLCAQESPTAFMERQKAEAKTQVETLLKSGTPRDRAWAAHLCVKHELKECIPALLAGLNSKFGDTGWFSSTGLCPDVGRVELEESRFPEATIQAIGNQAVLDALIRLGARPTAKELQPFFKGHPNEAIILLSRNPKEKENEAALISFLVPEFRNLVVNVLAASKSKLLAVKFLQNPVTIQAWVSTPRQRQSRQIPFGTVGATITTSAPCKPSGFPPIRFYKLVFPSIAVPINQKIVTSEGQLEWKVLDFGQSHELNGKLYSDSILPYFFPCRIQVAQVLEDAGAFRELPDFPVVSVQFPWVGSADACKRIAATCARTHRAFAELKQKFVAKNILTQAEADAIPLKIKVEIVDDRYPARKPLPKLGCPECPSLEK